MSTLKKSDNLTFYDNGRNIVEKYKREVSSITFQKDVSFCSTK